MISTAADEKPCRINEQERIIEPIRCNSTNIAAAIHAVTERYCESNFDYIEWENSEYLPTPTIVEAAQALYRGHNVHDITRSDAGAENLTVDVRGKRLKAEIVERHMIQTLPPYGRAIV